MWKKICWTWRNHVSCVTEIIGRYRHFKQKSSSIACRQFQEYITLDRASFTDCSKANRVRKFYTAYTVVVETHINYLKWLESMFLRLKIAKRNVQLLRTTLLCPSWPGLWESNTSQLSQIYQLLTNKFRPDMLIWTNYMIDGRANNHFTALMPVISSFLKRDGGKANTLTNSVLQQWYSRYTQSQHS